MHVLFSDDEPVILELLQDHFKDSFEDFTARSAENGAVALQLCHQEKFDLIIIDYRMPILDGEAFTLQLRNKPGLNQTTPIVLFSGFIAEVEGRLSALEEVYFMNKVFDLDRMINFSSVITRTPFKRPA